MSQPDEVMARLRAHGYVGLADYIRDNYDRAFHKDRARCKLIQVLRIVADQLEEN